MEKSVPLQTLSPNSEKLRCEHKRKSSLIDLINRKVVQEASMIIHTWVDSTVNSLAVMAGNG